MSWFCRNDSSTTNNSASKTWQSLMGSFSSGYSSSSVMNHAAMLEAAKSHWQQAFSIIQQHPSPTNFEMATTVVRHLDQLLTLLIAELRTQPDNTIGKLRNQSIKKSMTAFLYLRSNNGLHVYG